LFRFLDISVSEKYHQKALASPSKHYRIPNPETLSRLGEKGLVVVAEKPFFILTIFPHPPFGWLHFATENLDEFRKEFWKAINFLKKESHNK